jgi:hypothetical protein
VGKALLGEQARWAERPSRGWLLLGRDRDPRSERCRRRVPDLGRGDREMR